MKRIKNIFGKSHSRVSCVVSGALSRSLRLSQLCAAAPVTFARRGQRSVVTISPTLWIFQCAVICFISMIIIAGSLVNTGIFETTMIGQLLTKGSTVLLLMVNFLASFKGLKRLKEIISCLSKVQKVTPADGTEQTKSQLWQERKKNVLVFLFVTFTLTVVIADHSIAIIEEHHYLKYKDGSTKLNEVLSVMSHGSFALLYLTISLVELQFAIVVMEVYEAIGMVNDQLEQVALMATTFVVNPAYVSNTHESIRRLTLDFAIICDVIKRLDGIFGATVILALCLQQWYLIDAPFVIIEHLSSNGHTGDAILKMAWTVLHFVDTLILIEPPHWTLTEIQRTHNLVNKLKLVVVDVQGELEKFSSYLLLNTMHYSPMKLCVLERSLIISILSVATSYFVVTIQFKDMNT